MKVRKDHSKDNVEYNSEYSDEDWLKWMDVKVCENLSSMKVIVIGGCWINAGRA